MVAIAIGWQADGDVGGYGQPLDDTAVLVTRDANDRRDSSLTTGRDHAKPKVVCEAGYQGDDRAELGHIVGRHSGDGPKQQR